MKWILVCECHKNGGSYIGYNADTNTPEYVRWTKGDYWVNDNGYYLSRNEEGILGYDLNITHILQPLELP